MVIRDSRTRIWLVCILLLALALRMARAGELRMWGDEAYSVYSAQRTLDAITFEGADNDPHPPLYYYLLHFYMPLAGASELALRYFSIFSGTATIALLYVIGKRLFGARVGILAAASGALAPFHIYYSQEIRMYALAILLSAIAHYVFIRLLDEEAGKGSVDKRLWIAFALAMLLALYSLYHTAFVILAEGIFLLWQGKKRRAFFLRWLAVCAGVVALFLPWLAIRFSSTLGHLQERAGANIQALPIFLARGFAALTVGATLPTTTALALSIVFAVLILLGLGVLVRKRGIKESDGLVLALIIVPMVAVYPLYLLLPILVARLFALALVPLVILIARALSLLDRRVALGTAVVLAAICVYSLGDYEFRFDRYNAAAEDYIPAIRQVEQDARPGDVILFHAYWQIGYFLSHYRGPALDYRALDNFSDVSQAVAAPRGVWAIVQGLALHGSEAWLAHDAFPLSENKYGQMRVLRYQAGVPSTTEKFPTPVIFDNGMALSGYAVNGEEVESSRGFITLQLDWQATRTIDMDYTVSVRLVNPPNSARGPLIWAQEDSQPASGTAPTTMWQVNQIVQDRRAFMVPSGVPPGNYGIQIVLYDAKRGTNANILAPEDLRGQVLNFGQVTVTRPTEAASSKQQAASSRQQAAASRQQPAASWNEIELVGFSVGREELAPGDSLAITLDWTAYAPVTQDYVGVVQFIDATGQARPPVLFRPANETFPTRHWAVGEVWRDKLEFKIDPEASSGEGVVLIGLIGGSLGNPVLKTTAPWRELPTPPFPAPYEGEGIENGGTTFQALELTRIRVTGRERSYALPRTQFPMNEKFEDKVELLGYDLEAASSQQPAGRGEPLKLVLYWRALNRMGERYKVFVHLLNPSGELIAQRDSEPQDGRAPTTSWLRGEVIRDTYELEFSPTAPPGTSTLEVGLYRVDGSRRLMILDKNTDHLELGVIQAP